MADNKVKTEKKSKAPIIVIVILAIVLIAAGAFAILYFYGAFSQDNGGNEAGVSTTSDEFGTTAAQGMHGQLQPDSESSEETNIVIPPTEKDGEITYFSGKFIPNGKVVDRLTGNNNATLREVFGAGTLFGYSIMGSGYQPMSILTAPSGGFLTLGILLIIVNMVRKKMDAWINERREAKAA